MAAPNIVNVTTITGITTFIAGINTGGDGVFVTKNPAGVTTIVSNAASSGKVLKINSLVAAGIGATTGVTLRYLRQSNCNWCSKYSFNCINDCSSYILFCCYHR